VTLPDLVESKASIDPALVLAGAQHQMGLLRAFADD